MLGVSEKRQHFQAMAKNKVLALNADQTLLRSDAHRPQVMMSLIDHDVTVDHA
jgi:hypothetical protein